MMLRPLRLAGLTAGGFLRRYWQEKPLLARGALVEYADIVQPGTLFSLAGRDDLESRLIRRDGRRWRVQHGPFDPR